MKAITNLDIISGLKVDLASQLSKNFQLSGSWHFNKSASSFNLNTALINNPLVQDTDFAAATYHNDGKLESRAMLGLNNGYSVGGEAIFYDANRGYYSLEFDKYFDFCSAVIKVLAGTHSCIINYNMTGS